MLNLKGSVQIAANLKIPAKEHGKLIEYVKDRLDFAKRFRDWNMGRWKSIDREMAGYIVLDDEDKQRQLDNLRGFGPQIWDVNLPLTAAQIDEAVTFFTTVFFPEEGPYNAVTKKDRQEVAKGFSTLLNKQAAFYKHFENFERGAFDGLKYNLGMWAPEWRETKGAIVSNGAGGQARVEHNKTVMMGNSLEQLDVYNTLLDPSCPATQLYEKGEFFGIIEPETIFRAFRMEDNGEIFGLSDVITRDGEVKDSQFATHYYEKKPEILGDAVIRDGSSQYTDWVSFLSGTSSTNLIGSIEFQYVYIWLPAKRFKMSSSNVYEIWRLTIANMSRVVAAEQMKNAHGFLPLVACRPWNESTDSEATSYAEKLMPYQRFSSFQMNVHQRSARKKLYGVTVYNSKLVPEMKNADSLGGTVPTSSLADIDDIRKVAMQLNDTPDTSDTLRDIESMSQVMQQILPTDILKQVASLERATQYQAAATVQGANRRNLKIAKIIDSQALSTARRIMMYNIMEYQESMEILTPDGELVEIDPSELREQNFEFTISDALRGLDKLILIETMKDILNVLVQNPQAAAQFDISEIINYVTTLIGDHTSFNQFKFKNEFDKLTPEQKQMAFQLLQRAVEAQAQQEGEQQGAPAA